MYKGSKYTFLNDKEWLYQKYIIEKISAHEIARIVGAKSSQSIEQALYRMGIKIGRIRPKRVIGVSCYALLNDKEWLFENYVNKKLSTIDIAEIVGAKSASTVCQSLRRLGIPVRTKSEGHTCDREDEGFEINKSVIDGCLLGDAGLYCHSKDSDDSFPFFRKTNIYYDHIKYVGQILFPEKWEERITDGTNNGLYGEGRIFTLCSLTHTELLPFFNRWYPESNNYKKIIPNDIEINKDVLLHWFLDDGYSVLTHRKYQDRPQYNKDVVRVSFATQSFELKELEMLSKKIYNKFSLKIVPRYHQRNGKIEGSGYEMTLYEAKEQVKLFYNIIGSPPVDSLAYKWK